MAPGVTNYTALRGLANPTVASLQLTNFVINLSSTTRITYQPAISTTQFGSVITQDQFDFQSADGFQVDFLLSRNSFTIVKYGTRVKQMLGTFEYVSQLFLVNSVLSY